MDDQRFDDLTRRFARRISRRHVVHGLAVGVLAAAFGRGQQQTAAQEDVVCPPSLEAFRAELRARIRAIRALPPVERRAALRELVTWLREVRETCDLVVLPEPPVIPRPGTSRS